MFIHIQDGFFMIKFIATVAVLLFSFQPSFAKTFTSQYCEFELPLGWKCALEGTEWVCQSDNEDRQKEAIIILAAKIRGDRDSLDEYQAYLKDTKTFVLPGGRTQVSEPKNVDTLTTNEGHTWVDALHLASEVPGFYTRYLATVKEDLGVAVTFSVAQDHYDEYQPIFDKIIESLKVFRKSNSTGNYELAERDEGVNVEGLEGGSFIPDAGRKYDISNQNERKGGGIGGDAGTSILLLLLLGGGAFVVYKLRKKKGGGKSAKKKSKKKKKKKKSDSSES